MSKESTPKIYLYESDKPAKKYYIQYVNPKTGRLKKTYFGASGYDDYTTFPKAERDLRKERYLKRHRGMGENYNSIYTAGALAKFLLWNKPTLSASIKDTNERFDVRIIKKF